MNEVTVYKWQFKEIEPGKRVKRRLNFFMTEATARERYGDTIEPQIGTQEVRRGDGKLHSVEPMPSLRLVKAVDGPEFPVTDP